MCARALAGGSLVTSGKSKKGASLVLQRHSAHLFISPLGGDAGGELGTGPGGSGAAETAEIPRQAGQVGACEGPSWGQCIGGGPEGVS